MAKIDKLTEGVRQHLEPGEAIQASVQGSYETKIMGSDSVRTGGLFATDRRLVFFAKKLAGYDFESFPYKNISSLEQSKGMMGGTISFFASGNKVSMKWISDKSALAAFVAVLHRRMNEPSVPSPPASSTLPLPPPAPAAPDVMGQLKQLGELRDAGVLTDSEFESKKAEMLKRL